MAAVLSESVLDQNGPNDHFGQNDLIPNWILFSIWWTKMAHFGPFWPEGVHLGPPTVLWPFLNSWIMVRARFGSPEWNFLKLSSKRLKKRWKRPGTVRVSQTCLGTQKRKRHPVNERLVRVSTGKAIQWRGPGHSMNRRALKTEKLLSSSPSQK